MNIAKTVAITLGSVLITGTCVFGTLFFINKSDFSLFPRMENSVHITASIHTATRKEKRDNPILNYYQPVKVSFENKSRDIIEIESNEITLAFDTFKNVSKKLDSIRRKKELQKFLFGAAIVAFAVGVACIANNSNRRNNHYYAHPYVGPYYGPYYSSSYFCSTNNTYVTVINYNGTPEKKEVELLEPGQTITIPPYSTVTRMLACPRKEFMPSFSVEKKAKTTIFDVEIKEEK